MSASPVNHTHTLRKQPDMVSVSMYGTCDLTGFPAVSLLHVDVPAAALRERLPADGAHVRLLACFKRHGRTLACVSFHRVHVKDAAQKTVYPVYSHI